jgi:hypothetical protein
MHRIALAASAIVVLIACEAQPEMTYAEAGDALHQSMRSSGGEEATTEAIEVSTDFTIGEGLSDIAQTLADFWDSQADCTEVTVTANSVTVDYGGLNDTCTFNGKTYGGTHGITVVRADAGDVEVDHLWTDFTDGSVTVGGTADVTWSDDSGITRDEVHDLTWTDGEGTLVATGDHTLSMLDPETGVTAGFTLEGVRDWDADDELWHLDIIDVEFRLQDPVPQAGVYAVTNPEGKVLTLTFERQDEETIRATLEGTREPLLFDINRLGIPTEVES